MATLSLAPQSVAGECRQRHAAASLRSSTSFVALRVQGVPKAQASRGAALSVRAAKAPTKKKPQGKPAPIDTRAPLSGISVSEADEPNSRVRLTVTVPEAECKKVWDRTVREISRQVTIDGFRPGDRIPEYLLLRHVGERKVKKQVLEELLHSTLAEALDTVAERALKESEHIAQDAEDLIDSFSIDKSFQYDVTVDVIPEVSWTSERAYATMAVEVEVEDESSVAEGVEARIRGRHKDLWSLRVSTEGGIKMGDVAVVDISAFRINEDETTGDPIFSATAKGFQMDTEEGALGLLPGFVENILGTERTQTKEFDLVFPNSWQLESLRGVKGRFQVVCQEIFERELPALEDSIAEKFLPDAKSMDDVRERLLTALAQEKEQKKKQATMLALVDALADVCTMEVPPSLLEEQGRQMYGAKLIELQAGGRLSREDTASLMTENMVNNYLVAQKDKIVRQVKQALAVQEVFRLEGLSYSDEELEAELASAVAEFKAYGQEYDEARVREQAAELLEGAKVLEWLTKTCTVNYVVATSIK